MEAERRPRGGRLICAPRLAGFKFCAAMGQTQQPQHAIRRSTRLPLEVPIRVTSLDPSTPLLEECSTTLVNAHGCGMIAKQEIARGMHVRMEIIATQRHTTATVSEMVPLGGDPETWLIGLELDTPGNFWGIDYAPSDWKVDEVPAASVPAPANAERPAKSGRRWRLTDISTGACYLETVEPFDEGTPVLLSIRAANAECLLDGMVRISHAQAGMGVEFTHPEQKAPIADLIRRLTETREVPRIFVGRKEGQQRQEGLRHLEQQPDQEAPDPLLELVREGPTLSAEQFLGDLRAQRLGKRRDPRVDVAVPVQLSGTDKEGRAFDQQATTMNVSQRGAQLEGVRGRLQPGGSVMLARGPHSEAFRIVWVGAEGSAVAGQIGVSSAEPTSFWDEILEGAIASEQ